MNRQAKAPSAFTHGRSAALALALAAIALFAFVPFAVASKGGDSFLGLPPQGGGSPFGFSGGQFNTPQDIAVRQSTGQIYVAESSNHRVQRFSSSGTFERAWGVDVVTGGATGTGTLTNGSTTIASVLTTSKAFVVGQIITGTGIPAGTKITAVGAVSGSGTITLSQAVTASGSQELSVATDADNIPTNEVQTVNVTATGGNFKLAYTTPNPSPTTAGANTTANIPFNATAAEVQTALENLGNIGVGDVAVTSPNPTGGPYTVTFQGIRFADTNVNQMTAPAGSPALTGGTATVTTFRDGASVFERCTVAANCKAGFTIGISGIGGNPNDKLANGALSGPVGIAIDEDTGNVYVFDKGNNRVNVYDANGTFIRSFGNDVVAPGEPSEASTFLSETQRVAIGSLVGAVTGGTFTLTFSGQTTTPGVAYNANAAAVESALVALSNIGPGGVAVSGPAGGPWTVSFSGALAGTNVPPLEGNAAALEDELGSGFGTTFVEITTPQPGGPTPAFEVCPAVERCKAGTAGTAIGQFGSSGDGRVAVSPADGNAAAGFVYVGDTGAGNGTFGNPSNKRVLKFNLDGTLASSPVIPIDSGGSPLPRHVAVDAGGILYADSISRIFRYDPAANGGAGGFLAPIEPPLLSGNVQGMEIDPSNGHLLVVVNPSSGDTAIQEFANPGGAAPTLVDTHMQTGTGDVFTNGLGLVHSAAGDRLYVSGGAPINNRVLILDNDGGGTPPSLSVTPPTDVGTSQATLHGSVNPNGPTGFATSYRFEVSKNGVSWTPVNATTLIGDDAVSHPVSNVATSLEANTFYRVRLVTERAFNAGSTTSAELTFITDSVTPEIVNHNVQSFTDATAVLGANVNPNGKPTTYRFEYGKTTAYGSKAPVPDGNLTGTFPKYVSEQISGLEPNTTYHYRVVATNEEGTSTGADKTFTTRPALDPMPARAYEQVSAVDKNGYDVDTLFPVFQGPPVSPDGSRATYQSIGTFAGGEFGLANASALLWYQAVRTPTGWTNTPIGKRGTSGDALANVPFKALLGEDGSAGILSAEGSIDEGPDPHGGLYSLDMATNQYTPLVKEISSFPSFRAASRDGSHLVVSSVDVLTADAGIPASGNKLYELTDGEIRLVSFNASNVPFATAVTTGAAYENPVSDDGNHIFFTTPTSGNGVQIYRRSEGTTTKLVSPSKRTPVDPSGAKAKQFVGATPDQGPDDPAMVFFTSSEQLTNNANTGPSRIGRDLYRYDINSDSLVDISAESNTATGARVQSLLGHSEDGKWVYYVASGQVIAGKGVDGQPNVYLWHDDGSANGTTKLVGTLAQVFCNTSTGSTPTFPVEDGCSYVATSSKVGRVSADGQSLIFQSTASLTGYANGGLSQVFIYEADAKGGAGQLSCVSCRSDGSSPQGASSLGRSSGEALSSGELTRSLSADGSRVFFNSADALVPEDTNGLYDVYEWDEGRVHLISSGTETTDDTIFSSASSSGDDVFFITRDRLVGQDEERLYDLYDARVGGGIAQQNEPPPGEPCTGEACKPAVSGESPAPAPSSSAQSGSGNVKEKAPRKKCRKNRVKRRGKCVRKSSIKRSKAKAKAKKANKSRGAGK